MEAQSRRRRVAPSDAGNRAREIIPDPMNEQEAPEPEPSTRVDNQPQPTPTPRDPNDVRGPWGTIIDSVIAMDPEITFGALRRALTLRDDHTNYASVAADLDRADSNYFEASMLVRAAKLEEQQVDRTVAMRMEVLRTAARSKIEEEKRAAAKESGSKASGKATLEEVRDRCYADWPDEVSSLERRSQEFHAARAVVEELAQAWRSRAASLRELIAGLRGR